MLRNSKDSTSLHPEWNPGREKKNRLKTLVEVVSKKNKKAEERKGMPRFLSEVDSIWADW